MKKVLCMSGLILTGILVSGCGKGNDSVQNKSVEYEGISYTGQFSENFLKSGVLDGQGTFTFTDVDDETITISGTWKNGKLDGEAEIQLPDGSVVETVYKKGTASGEARRALKDGTNMQFQYEKGEAAGKIIYSDPAGRTIGVSQYYNGQTAEAICDLAKEVNWQEVQEDPGRYEQQAVKIEGTVTDIYGDEKKTYLAVRDRDGQTVLCEYSHEKTAAQQALIPEFATGEQAVVYGYISRPANLNFSSYFRVLNYTQLEETFSVEEYENAMKQNANYHTVRNSDLVNRVPVVKGVCAENVQASEIDYRQLDRENAVAYEYDLIAEHPYLVSSFMLRDTAEVIWKSTDEKAKRIFLLLQKQESKEIYYAEYPYEKGEDLPEDKEIITFEGVLQGCEKLQQIVGERETKERVLVTVPRIVLNTIE